jgi:hypothetical protein
MQAVWQPKIADGLGKASEHLATGEIQARERLVEITLITTPPGLPKSVPARVGHFHSPGPRSLHAVTNTTSNLVGCASSESLHHLIIICSEQINPLIEDWEFGEFHVGQACGRRGNRRIKDRRIAQGCVEPASRVNRWNGLRHARFGWPLHTTAGGNLGTSHMRMEIDPTRHHHPTSK